MLVHALVPYRLLISVCNSMTSCKKQHFGTDYDYSTCKYTIYGTLLAAMSARPQPGYRAILAPMRGQCVDRVVIMGLLPVGAPGRHHRLEDRGGRRFGLQACHPERRSSVAGGAGHGLNIR